ncbi:MAG TPA: aminoacyl-tRNA hydrolase [Methylomirabilota bacterium]|nr:aminoacyl-tRNA hydrolase [Methylomirabilota bacterium]
MAHVVVGLGNPGPEYRDTRHNVGQRVLEHLARERLGRTRWDEERDHTLVCATVWRGEPLRLVKPWAFMNESGPALARALRRHHADAHDVILVYDDIDLPLGAVRVRLKGGHGGHNGVRSVIETLGTSDIRRVKVGIGRPDHKGDVPDHVLSVFEPEEVPAVDAAVAEAADRVLALVQSPAAR